MGNHATRERTSSFAVHIRPCSRPGFSDAQLAAISRMMPDLIGRLDLRNYVAWFYTPMALPLLNDISPSAVIYDCMDELSAFLGAPKELLDPGRASAENRRSRFHRRTQPVPRQSSIAVQNVHCFPSSVDAKHYAKARPGGSHEAADQKACQDRASATLASSTNASTWSAGCCAQGAAEWQIVMVGPVVKIDPARCRGIKHPLCRSAHLR